MAIELREMTRDLQHLMDRRFSADAELECNMNGHTAAEAARFGLDNSEYCYAIWVGADLLGFCGYQYDGLCGPCAVWVLPTPASLKHKLAFVKFLYNELQLLLLAGQVSTTIPASFAKTRRLAEHFGFRFGEPLNGFICGVAN